MRNRHFLYIIGLLIAFLSCEKQEIGPQCPTCVESNIAIKYDDVLIGCEGNFGWGNASLSLYNPTDTSISNNLFQNTNSYALGDVLQSVTEYNGKLYLVVNNSGKVEVLDTSSYQKTATISGLTSPRYFCGINSSKAYISDLYSNQIVVIDLNTNTVSGNIITNGWTEEIIFINNKVFVCMPDTNFILQINVTTDLIEDTIIVAKGPNSMILDKNNQLWVLCSGGINEEIGELNQINPTNNAIMQTIIFSNLNESPNNLKIDNNKEQLYFLNNGVFQLSILDNILPTNAVIQQNGALFYGLGISPTKEIYVSDAVDYVQAGIIYRYDSIGNLIHQFTVGIIPQSFWFK